MRGRSRYYRHQIMSNTGFGPIIFIREHITVCIPQKFITTDGHIYKKIQKLLDKEDYETLATKYHLPVTYKNFN